MPVQPTDSRSDVTKTNPDVFGGLDKEGRDKKVPGQEGESSAVNEPNQANYGFGAGAGLDTEAEQTEPQEYKEGGLQETARYSAERTPRDENPDRTPSDVEHKDVRGKTGCGC